MRQLKITRLAVQLRPWSEAIAFGMRAEAEFDVIVVGAGHAGTEAAVAAARLGARVGLITTALETIGQMSCNPAIGGVAKGTVVREVDALGGIMGKATDLAMIQFRMLNRSKGAAVWAPRAQCDRGLYRRAVRQLVETFANVHTIQGTVARLLFQGDRLAGVETLEGRQFASRAVVLTTGTFLRGRIHIGTETSLAGGRAGEGATVGLAEQLEGLGLTVDRFKTGTPPRLDGRTVDYSALTEQQSELEEFRFRWSVFWTYERQNSDTIAPKQLSCHIAFLEEPGKDIIARNIGKSAMYGGAIAGRGPRYCPSVEDKIVKFPDAERHQLFLEPEGHDTSELYVNGLSTSLPADVQLEVIRSVRGLERARMTRAGYAIEYDYFPPTQLDSSLQVRALPGLFFAGQINGTTGYEEAAGQGLYAGLNAALTSTDRPGVHFGREASYIGVLVDDLVTRGVDEPYRLFTSRSEFRLTVRQDNAIGRLADVGRSLGLYSEEEERLVDERLRAETQALELASATPVPAEVANRVLEGTAGAGSPVSQTVRAVDLVRRQGVGLAAVFESVQVGGDLPLEAITTAELQIKYAGYFARERTAADRMKRMGGFGLESDLPYEEMRSLSFEARQKLGARRPSTLAQAAGIPGVSPSDLQNLVLEVERRRRSRGA